MNRLLTLACVALVFVAMFGLYQLSYRVDAQENRLRALAGRIGEEKQAIAVLRAEWAYLARPQTIQSRAVENLGMMPALPSQVVRFADLPDRQQRLIVAGKDDPEMPGAAFIATGAGGSVPVPRARPPMTATPVPARPMPAPTPTEEAPAPVISVAGSALRDGSPPDGRVVAASAPDAAGAAGTAAPAAANSTAAPAAARASGRGLLPADMEARLLRLAAEQRSARDDAPVAMPVSATGGGR